MKLPRMAPRQEPTVFGSFGAWGGTCENRYWCGYRRRKVFAAPQKSYDVETYREMWPPYWPLRRFSAVCLFTGLTQAGELIVLLGQTSFLIGNHTTAAHPTVTLSSRVTWRAAVT